MIFFAKKRNVKTGKNRGPRQCAIYPTPRGPISTPESRQNQISSAAKNLNDRANPSRLYVYCLIFGRAGPLPPASRRKRAAGAVEKCRVLSASALTFRLPITIGFIYAFAHVYFFLFIQIIIMGIASFSGELDASIVQKTD